MYVRKGEHIVNTDNFRNINLDESHNSVGFHGGDGERFILLFKGEGNARCAYESLYTALKKGKNAIDLSKIL